MKKLSFTLSALLPVLLVLTGCSLFDTASPAAEMAPTASETTPPIIDVDTSVTLPPPPAAEPASQPSAQTPPPPPPPPAALQPKVISLDVGNLFFSPKNLQFKLNQPIRVDYTNKGHHTFTVDGLGVNILLKDNDSGSFTFTPKKEGMFELYCGTPGHSAGGMTGTVTVTK